MRDVRDKPTEMLICDLCDKEIIEEDDAITRGVGSLLYTSEYQKRPSDSSKSINLRWPPSLWFKISDVDVRRSEKYKPRAYDFHGDCILRVVEEAVALRVFREQNNDS